jgi:hypothetical protein
MMTYIVDLVQGNVARVLDVLLLFAVPWGLWGMSADVLGVYGGIA